MRILPIYNQSNSNYKKQKNSTQFKAWDREVFRTPTDAFIKELKHRNDTSFFRDGAFWNTLTYYLLLKYNQILYIATITAKIYCIWSRRVRNSEDCRYRFANIPKRAPPSLSYKPCRSLILLFQKNIV